MIRQKSAGKGIVRADEFDLIDDEPIITNGKRRERQWPGQSSGRRLHYFVPCVVGGKMVAVIGLGRARDGSLLSSEDLEILKTVSGYIAVAIENSRLYDAAEAAHRRACSAQGI